MARNKGLSSETRQYILVLRNEGYSMREIANKLKILYNVVYYSLHRTAQMGSNQNRQRSGRHRCTAEQEDKHISVQFEIQTPHKSSTGSFIKQSPPGTGAEWRVSKHPLQFFTMFSICSFRNGSLRAASFWQFQHDLHVVAAKPDVCIYGVSWLSFPTSNILGTLSFHFSTGNTVSSFLPVVYTFDKLMSFLVFRLITVLVTGSALSWEVWKMSTASTLLCLSLVHSSLDNPSEIWWRDDSLKSMSYIQYDWQGTRRIAVTWPLSLPECLSLDWKWKATAGDP